MADRTSAGLFSKIFNLLAESPTEEHKSIAAAIYPMRDEFDFSDYQMCCDESLIKLGLAKMEIDPNYPEDGEVVVYNK